MSNIKKLAAEVSAANKYQDNLFFKNLDSMSLYSFVKTQEQFYHAVRYFNRPMLVMAAQLEELNFRSKILENAWEEHGQGDLLSCHEKTFEELLYGLGGKVGSSGQGVNNFNSQLMTLAKGEVVKGIIVYGMIEYMFSSISATLGKNIVDRKWLDKENLVHYNLHEKLDVQHSDDFFEIIDGFKLEDREIIVGLELGCKIFNELYEDLYRENC